MSRIEYYKFYPDDFLSSPWVMAADLKEEGAYHRLLMLQWKSSGCQIENNLKKIRSFLKNQISEETLKKILESNFYLFTAAGRPVENLWETCGEKTFWRNMRLYSEFQKALLTSEKATKSIDTRWSREKDNLLNKLNNVNTKVVQENIRTNYQKDTIQSQIQNHITSSDEVKKKTKESIAQEKAETQWLQLVSEVAACLRHGSRIGISDRMARDVIHRIGGSKRLREDIDKPEYHSDFVEHFIKFEIDQFKERKKT